MINNNNYLCIVKLKALSQTGTSFDAVSMGVSFGGGGTWSGLVGGLVSSWAPSITVMLRLTQR